MTSTLTEDLLSQFSELVAARTALHFPRERWGDLERKMGSAANEFGFDDVKKFVRWLESSPMTQEQVEILASHLTIGETYFWREPRVFEALEEQILPELIRSRQAGEKRLRIWCAGCSSGEEPYSVAIALRRALPAVGDWSITILATDINPHILRKAAAGVYGEWSLRDAPKWLAEGCFRSKKDGKHEILPEIRKMVTFAYHNLACDIYPSPLNNTNAMDVIFCRNVLMYFAHERARTIGQNLCDALVEGGRMMVGASELSQELFPQLTAVRFPGTIVYRKEQRHPRSATAFPAEITLPKEPLVQQPVKPAAYAHAPVKRSATKHPASTRAEKVDQEVPLSAAPSVRALADQGRLAEPLASCDEAIAAEKLDAGLYCLRATIQQELNRDGDAIASLKQALYLDAKSVMAHSALGNLAKRQGNTRTAQRHFENVLALLASCQQEDVLLESEGLTVGRFRAILKDTMHIGAYA